MKDVKIILDFISRFCHLYKWPIIIIILITVVFLIFLFLKRVITSYRSKKRDKDKLTKHRNQIKSQIDNSDLDNTESLTLALNNIERAWEELLRFNNPFLLNDYKNLKVYLKDKIQLIKLRIEEIHLEEFQNIFAQSKKRIYGIKNRYIRFSEIIEYKENINNTYNSVKEYDFRDLETKAKELLAEIAKAIRVANSDFGKMNDDFIEREKARAKDLFYDNSGGQLLTEEQIRAVISDDDRELVIAGAGSGKTRVIDFKVRYLVNYRSVDPSRIILLSFSKKSASDLVEKISSHVSGIQARTIHSFCMSFLRENKELIQPAEQKRYVLDSLAESLEDKAVFKSFFRFYNNHYSDVKPLIFYDNINDLRKDLRKLNSKLVRVRDQFEEVKPRRTFLTLKGDYVRSVDERYIADFLFLQDIDYIYESKYPHGQTDYYPDFYLSSYDINLEHYAITENGTPPPTFRNPQRYLDGMKWKKDLHNQYNTKLVESYSYMLNSTDSTSHYLANLLSHHGVKIEKNMKELQAYKKVSRRFAEFFQKFYNLYKLSGKSLADLSNDMGSGAISLFLMVFKSFMNNYEERMRVECKMDFTDLIIEGRRSLEYSPFKSYDYIIVDEFQDTSNIAMEFLNEVFDLSKKPCFFSVGDDWQSIYGFNGSDVTIMSDYSEIYPGISSHKLSSNFRSHSDIVKLGNEFISKNPSQIIKDVKSGNNAYDTCEIDFYDFQAMEERIRQIPEDESVFVLYRYNDDCPAKQGIFKNMFNLNRNGKPIKKKGVKRNISLMTIHASKGLEARHVFLLFPNGNNRKFPSETVDHFVFDILKHKEEVYPFAEERRLMYVAITRAEQNMYFVSPRKGDPNSVFWDELREIVKN